MWKQHADWKMLEASGYMKSGDSRVLVLHSLLLPLRLFIEDSRAPATAQLISWEGCCWTDQCHYDHMV